METKEKEVPVDTRYGAQRLTAADAARMAAATIVLVAIVAAVLALVAHLGVNLGGSRDYVSCTGRSPNPVAVEVGDNPTTLARKHFAKLPEQMVADAIIKLNPQGISPTGGAWMPGTCNGEGPT